MRYVLAVMANDPSRVIRRHVARNACHSLALLVQMGEMKSTLKESESLLIEEDGSLPEKTKESKKSEMEAMIKVLRKDREVGKNEALREFMMPIALYVQTFLFSNALYTDARFRAPDVDHEVRWCVLKLSDILIRGVDETAPTVKLHLPPTPVTETAPQLPPVKVPVKTQRTLKSGGSPIKSPLVPFTIPSKLKLPGASQPNAVPRTPGTPLMEAAKRGVVFATPAPPKPLKPKGRPPKGHKPSHVPKAQSGGMSLNDLRASRNALKKLQAHKHAAIFMQPVDPIRDHAPKYVG
jgi:transcription initiation factor TFIID subunit 2